MSQRLYLPFEQVFSNLGVIGAGYKIYTYVTQTDTPKATYSNVGLTVANTNPIVADSAGRFGNIYGSSATLYKFILKTDQDVTIATADPVDPQTFTLADFNPIPAAYWGTTGGTSAAYTLDSDVDISLIGYQNTQVFFITFHTSCAEAPTLNIDGLGALNLKKYTGQGTKVALQANDVGNQTYIIRNDGSDLVVLNPRTQVLYLGTAPTLTITSDTITVTNACSNYVVDTSSFPITLNTINGLASGQYIILGISSNSNPLTIATGADNIINPNGINIVLSTTSDKVSIFKDPITGKCIVLNATYSKSNPIQLIQTKTLGQ